MSKLAYCSLCGHDIRSRERHMGSAEHRRKAMPITSRRGARANAKRAARRAARHTLTKAWEDDMWEWEERMEREAVRELSRLTGRHWYGAWTKHGQPAYAGGRPGTARKKAKRKPAKRKARR